MTDDIAIKVDSLRKVYHLYDKPQDRFKEALNPFRKSYHHDFYAVNDISFEIKKGETVGIIGKNGAGKSTLLKMITGVLTPTSGNIQVNGKIASLLELGAGFNPEMTGLENIFLNGTLMGFSKQEMDTKIVAILEFADIGDFIYQPVKVYSSGMFARLAFSVAINAEPEILIIDEALAVGDMSFQQKCNLFLQEKMKNVTILFVSHDMSSVANLTTRSMVIDKGVIQYIGVTMRAIEIYTNILLNKDSSGVSSNMSEKEPEKNIEFEDVPFNKMSGKLDIRIQSYSVKVNPLVTVGDKVEVYLGLTSDISTNNLIVGYYFSDRFGTKIFGENSVRDTSDLNLNKGSSEASFHFLWPEIPEGSYFLTVGVGTGKHAEVHQVQCWVQNILEIKSKNSKVMHGLINNPLLEFKLVQLEKSL